MISFWWAVVSFFVGGLFGIFIAALIMVGGGDHND